MPAARLALAARRNAQGCRRRFTLGGMERHKRHSPTCNENGAKAAADFAVTKQQVHLRLLRHLLWCHSWPPVAPLSVLRYRVGSANASCPTMSEAGRAQPPRAEEIPG